MQKIFKSITVNILCQPIPTRVCRRGNESELKSTDSIWFALTFR